MQSIIRSTGAALAVCGLLAAMPAWAQGQPAAAPSLEQQQREHQADQPGNNAPVWREVKSGEENYTSIKGRETGILVQPQARFPGQDAMTTAGEAWRKYRNGPVTGFGGWLLLIVALAIAVYYFMKGPIRLEGKPTGRLIERFNSVQRVAHWCMGISFCVLAASGLIMLFGKYVLLPVIGYTLFAWLAALSKNLHNFVGPFFIVSTLAFIAIYVKDNLPAAIDLKWLAKGGGLLTGEHVPSGRFNAGEKSFFWVGVVALSVVMSVTGLVLLFPNFDQLRITMQQMSIIHAVAAILYIAMSFGHFYIGTIGMEGAYQSMRSGSVDETWAREHHELWYNEVKARKPGAPGGAAGSPAGAVPAGAPRAKRNDTGD